MKKLTRKKYPFKQFKNFHLGSSQFDTLKVFRSKKQFTRDFKISSMDLVSNGVIEDHILNSVSSYRKHLKNYTLDHEKNFCSIDDNTTIFLQLDRYINSIIIYNFIINIYNELKKDKILKPEVRKNLWSYVKQHTNIYCPSLQHRLDKDFFKLYHFLNYNQINSFTQFIIERSRKNSVLFRVYSETLKSFKDVLNYLDWNLDQTTKINQCTISGLYFRNAQLTSFYRGISSECLLQVSTKFRISLFNSEFLTDDSELFIKNNFCRLATNGTQDFSYNSICRNLVDRESSDIFGLYLSSKKTIILSCDDKTLKDYPSVNLQSNNNKLREYSFRVHHNLPFAEMEYEKNKTDNLYLGLEIECNKTSRCPSKIHQLLEEDILSGRGVVKSDGSLGSRGIEINLVPMTLDFVKYTDFFFNFENRTKEYLSSYNDIKTGIHIHIPKKLFTKFQISLLLQFINKRGNYDYICKVGGRDLNNSDNSYARTRPSINYFKGRSTDRYSALNNCNSETLEFRLFKGNLSSKTIYRYVEFVHSLATFVLSREIKPDTNYKDFVKWLFENKANYPILYKFTIDFIKPLSFGNFAITKKVKREETSFKKIESFQVRYNKRYRDIKFNVPELKLATPLRLRKIRAVRSGVVDSENNQ